jgi:nicotinamide-nucleotide amidase
MLDCSLLAVGNELLNGDVRDLNLFTLSRRLTHAGITVTQAAIARDTPADVVASVRFLLAQEPQVMICSGGLGPTEDDMTLSGLAQALGRELRDDAEARRMVEAQYEHLMRQGYLVQRGPEMARAKMARLPQGARPLPNPIGTAPGVRLEVGRTLIYVLPGVPAELEAILDASVMPELRERFTPGVWAEQSLRVHVDDEAEVAAPLREVRMRHTTVYLKSLARPFPAAGEEGLRIIASTLAGDAASADQTVAAALRDLRRTLEEAGLRVVPGSMGSDDGGPRGLGSPEV